MIHGLFWSGTQRNNECCRLVPSGDRSWPRSTHGSVAATGSAAEWEERFGKEECLGRSNPHRTTCFCGPTRLWPLEKIKEWATLGKFLVTWLGKAFLAQLAKRSSIRFRGKVLMFSNFLYLYFWNGNKSYSKTSHSLEKLWLHGMTAGYLP